MPYKDPEKKREAMRKYHEKNKEKIAEQKKQYREDNKEKIAEYNKQNKEKKKEYFRKYRQSEKGKKSVMISQWKTILGVIYDNFNELYEHYINTHSCDVCHYVFDEHNWRCLDHDHETGLFRQILCHRCNVQDNWKKIIN